MIRYAIMGLDKNGDWINLFKDERTYKTVKTAKRMYELQREYISNELKIVDIEVETVEELLSKAVLLLNDSLARKGWHEERDELTKKAEKYK